MKSRTLAEDQNGRSAADGVDTRGVADFRVVLDHLRDDGQLAGDDGGRLTLLVRDGEQRADPEGLRVQMDGTRWLAAWSRK